MASVELYPLQCNARSVEPIWGGRRLAPWLGWPEPHPERLGEVWIAYDQNEVLNGVLAGQSLADLAATYGAELVGTRSFARYGADFPLLAKFLDAADRLSIQVHPDDAYAHQVEAHTGFHGKTEAWYILETDSGAEVIHGMLRAGQRDEFAAAVEAGQVEMLLRRLPVQPGDVVFVPAGTVHAINAGVMLFEIQQKSDLTYRVYDYQRRDAKTGQLRELHLAKALDVMNYAAAQQGAARPLRRSDIAEVVVACPYFALEHWNITGSLAASTDPASFEILIGIGGSIRLEHAATSITLASGSSVVLPASTGAYQLEVINGPCRLLRVFVPDLADDVLAPLRAAGHSEAAIGTVVFVE
jgi:mannose-6-phosphate isomerase